MTIERRLLLFGGSRRGGSIKESALRRISSGIHLHADHSDGPAFHTNYQRGISVCATLLTRELPAWIHPCSRLAQPCVYGCFSACSQYRELTLPAQRLSIGVGSMATGHS
jgi:hypothetical protein